jgi:hypothetical protein
MTVLDLCLFPALKPARAPGRPGPNARPVDPSRLALRAGSPAIPAAKPSPAFSRPRAFSAASQPESASSANRAVLTRRARIARRRPSLGAVWINLDKNRASAGYSLVIEGFSELTGADSLRGPRAVQRHCAVTHRSTGPDRQSRSLFCSILVLVTPINVVRFSGVAPRRGEADRHALSNVPGHHSQK